MSNNEVFFPEMFGMTKQEVIEMIEERILEEYRQGEIDYTTVGQPDIDKFNDGMMQNLVNLWYGGYMDDVMDGLDPEGSAVFRQEQAMYRVACKIQKPTLDNHLYFV